MGATWELLHLLHAHSIALALDLQFQLLGAVLDVRLVQLADVLEVLLRLVELEAAHRSTGGARAHAQLSAVLSGTLTPVYLAPSVLVPAVHEKFDASGGLIDEVTEKRLAKTLSAFQEWAAAIA